MNILFTCIIYAVQVSIQTNSASEVLLSFICIFIWIYKMSFSWMHVKIVEWKLVTLFLYDGIFFRNFWWLFFKKLNSIFCDNRHLNSARFLHCGIIYECMPWLCVRDVIIILSGYSNYFTLFYFVLQFKDKDNFNYSLKALFKLSR